MENQPPSPVFHLTSLLTSSHLCSLTPSCSTGGRGSRLVSCTPQPLRNLAHTCFSLSHPVDFITHSFNAPSGEQVFQQFLRMGVIYSSWPSRRHPICVQGTLFAILNCPIYYCLIVLEEIVLSVKDLSATYSTTFTTLMLFSSKHFHTGHDMLLK